MVTGQSYLSNTGIYKFLCAIVFAVLGGILGVNQNGEETNCLDKKKYGIILSYKRIGESVS